MEHLLKEKGGIRFRNIAAPAVLVVASALTALLWAQDGVVYAQALDTGSRSSIDLIVMISGQLEGVEIIG